MEKQQQLLASQPEALKGLQSLIEFQSKDLQESRVSLQQIVGFVQEQHQELKEQQEHLLQAHNLLASNSKSMLEAQLLSRSKQICSLPLISSLPAQRHELNNMLLIQLKELNGEVCLYVRILVSKEFLESVEKTALSQRPAWRVKAAKVDYCVDSVLLMLVHSVFPQKL